MPTIEPQVSAATDDADESTAGSVDTTQTNIRVRAGQSRNYGGMRFVVTGPASGDTIDVAYLIVEFALSTRDDPDFLIYCEAADDAATFADATANDISGRTKTTASVDWSATGVGGTGVQSPSIVGPVQEVINRPGWSSGNAMVIILYDDDGDSNAYITSYDGSPSTAPVLHIEYTAAGGGTTHNESMAGSITPAGVIVRQTEKGLAGSFSPDGALIRQMQKAFSGAITPSSAMVRQTDKPLGGSVAPIGALSRLIGKSPGGGITPSGALARQIEKGFGGTVTPTGALDVIKTILLSLAGSIAPSGDLLRQTQKALSGAVAPAGGMVRQISKMFSGTVTPAGALTAIRSVLLSLAGSIAPAGSMARQVSKSLAGSITPGGVLLKTIFKTLSGGISPAGALAAVLSGVTVIVETIFKSMFRGLFRRMK